ncbi:alpha/beta hydrolase fold domain-containing protein [Limisphaera ngatamarikiensis]|uniref:Alpha/beta hydrolase fold domain-containing protein n=1 Tax=Limisphaera ngatamarikiensis TaxID=1324935 RepID=A0A6M1RZ22_9BACT|nr:alpha/beta hydrolase fold domain-containing protein [Limisphaera ngatamarikiensis]NGO40584.1 alpha/beta hydrolase fold domain-containing protein [Limisphaera ngatamarikiensis]
MKPRSVLRIAFRVATTCAALLTCISGLLWLYFHPPVQLQRGVPYGSRNGHTLTLDVARPAHPNGCGVLLMMSGGWQSRPGSFRPWLVAPLLRRGYTVFAVYHVPQPEATVMEIVEDVRHALQHVYEHAAEYGVDPRRLGVTGGSSGGHLALMLACSPEGNAEAASTRAGHATPTIAAAAVFFPVTDLLNLGDSTENPGDGGPPRSFVRAFGPQATNLTVWRGIGRSVSPIYHVHPGMPPVLIIHGDADTLVPLDQSLRFQQEATRLGATVKVIVRHGAGHGWWTLPWDIRRFADWFDQYLLRPAPRHATAP